MTVVKEPKPVQTPLTLVLEARSQVHHDRLVEAVTALQAQPPALNPVVRALNTIRTVHFARFVFLGDRRLAVITTYDGSFEHYILDFVAELHGTFDQLLAHVEGWPEGWSVRDHPDEFLAFVQERDLRCVGTFYSAYPNHSVVAIQRGPR